MNESERLLTTAEAAALLRQTPGTIRRKVAVGEIRGVRLTRSNRGPLRIPAAELERYLSKGARRAAA
jgi:excisionase family DNA binding protein